VTRLIFDPGAIDPMAASALHSVCFEAMGERGWTVKEMTDLLSNPSVFAGAACENDQFIALVLAQISEDEAEILTICVAQNYRRAGIARQLIQNFN